MAKSAIVIPVYKTSLNKNEIISLNRCLEVFKGRDIIVVYPDTMDISMFKDKFQGISNYLPFKSAYFKSVQTYSRLLNIPYFYKYFRKYQFILIHQLDVFVFEDKLDYWCSQGYDYIGAPWIDALWISKLGFIGRFVYPVGNGGFSLRKVSKFYWGSILLFPVSTFLWKKKWNEDFFWSTVAHRLIPGFKVPDVKKALEFAFEEHPSKCFELNGYKLPFGCHAWEKYDPDFWDSHFQKYGYQIHK